MSLTPKFRIVIYVMAVVSLAAAGCHPETFQGFSFTQALDRAGRDHKVVMIEFYAAWCMPCKKLDKTTWSDPAVRKWLVESAIALKVDAEKSVGLAERFGVNSYPTIIFVDVNGTKIDQIVGYIDPKTFLDQANGVLAGITSLNRAEKELVGHETDPIRRQNYADTLAQAGKYDRALTEYLWCFDHGAESPRNGYGSVRRSFLLSKIVALGARCPAAIRALEDRRDHASELLLSGGEQGELIGDVAALSSCLKTPEHIIDLYDRMKERDLVTPRLHWRLVLWWGEILIDQKRYRDFLDDPESPVVAVEAKISSAKDDINDRTSKVLKSVLGESAERESARIRRRCVTDASLYYEALLGTGRGEQADLVAERLIDFWPSGLTFTTLIQRARHAGETERAHGLADRGRRVLAGKEKDDLEQFLVKATETGK